LEINVELRVVTLQAAPASHSPAPLVHVLEQLVRLPSPRLAAISLKPAAAALAVAILIESGLGRDELQVAGTEKVVEAVLQFARNVELDAV
jgi:hypothetical protein